MPVSYTFSPTYQPDWGIERSHKPRVLKAEFGDGYAQRAADGINNNPVTLQLRWTNATESEKDYITGFFDARYGVESFYFTYADESTPKAYVCEEWSYTHSDVDGYIINATFKQVYDI